METGRIATFTREPSGRRASTIGDDFVDSTSNPRDDLVDDAEQVSLVLEANVSPLKLAEAFDETKVVGIYEDVADGRVLKEWLNRTVSGHLGQHFAGK